MLLNTFPNSNSKLSLRRSPFTRSRIDCIVLVWQQGLDCVLMGNHDHVVVEDAEGSVPSSAQTFKVHARMCSELLKMVAGVSKIFPEIEAARPRCSSGIDALCLLSNRLDKAKSLLQHCNEASVLYLALNGDSILSRCKKSRTLLEDSLIQIQYMVPVMLAAKISGITTAIKIAAFRLDPSEEEAGRLLRELLQRYCSALDSTEKSTLASFHTVCSMLRISSKISLLIEKRSIRKLLDKFDKTEPTKKNETESTKKNILLLILKLLNKYAKAIAKDPKDYENPVPYASPYRFSSSEVQFDILSGPEPPEEFVCPLSSSLMRDPVIIASGQTYERAWIQKWFDEGHNFCPRTNENLAHKSFTTNAAMKALISRWCAAHDMALPEPETRIPEVRPWESPENSIVSLSSSMNDLHLPHDFSGVSLGSMNEVKPVHLIVDTMLHSEFSSLPWDSRRHMFEEMNMLLRQDGEFMSVVPSGKLIVLILGFVKDARELRDADAQVTGCMVLLEFLQQHGNTSISYFDDDAYSLLASFLDTEVSKQALHVLKLLSANQRCHHKIAASEALLTGITNILINSQNQELLEPTLQILINLSSNDDIRGSSVIPYKLIIPKLIPLFEDDSLSRHCMTILKNLSEDKDARISIAVTDGCLSSVSRVLEKDDREEQELAVAVLLNLYAHRMQCCKLVMDDEAIACLILISINGNMKGKAMALELLRIMRDETSDVGGKPGPGFVTGSVDEQREEIRRPKAGLFGKFFSKKMGKN